MSVQIFHRHLKSAKSAKIMQDFVNISTFPSNKFNMSLNCCHIYLNIFLLVNGQSMLHKMYANQQLQINMTEWNKMIKIT